MEVKFGIVAETVLVCSRGRQESYTLRGCCRHGCGDFFLWGRIFFRCGGWPASFSCSGILVLAVDHFKHRKSVRVTLKFSSLPDVFYLCILFG